MDEKTKAAVEAASEAGFDKTKTEIIETVTPLIEILPHAFSPTGQIVVVKRNVTLLTRKTPKGYAVVKSRSYVLMDEEGTLGGIDNLDEISESMRRAAMGEDVGDIDPKAAPFVIDGVAVTLNEVMASLAVQEAGTEDKKSEFFKELFRTQSKPEASMPSDVPVTHVSLQKKFFNHSFTMQAISNDVLNELAAKGESGPIAPRKGKSKEKYSFTASTANAKRFLESGGNALLLKDVLDTVQSLKETAWDDAIRFDGRVWFPVSTILEEMLRTTAGTPRARDHKELASKINDALTLASGMQLKGVGPDGKTLNLDYLENCVRREEVTHQKVVYRDVWGFDVVGTSLNGFMQSSPQVYRYPLTKKKNPNTIGQSGAERIVKNMLNEARTYLYTPSGNSRAKKTKTVKKSWPEIFDSMNQGAEMNSRKKNSIVRDFENVIRALAEAESKDELREGRPLYIRATSERDPRRGYGAGAWKNLVLECSTEFHAPEVDLGITKPKSAKKS